MNVFRPIVPKDYEAINIGRKSFEVLRADTPIAVGDTLILRELHQGNFTGRKVVKIISHVVRKCTGLEPGYVIVCW